jgi:hypothetical protein
MIGGLLGGLLAAPLLVFPLQ